MRCSYGCNVLSNMTSTEHCCQWRMIRRHETSEIG
jgi:hypothetical protein